MVIAGVIITTHYVIEKKNNDPLSVAGKNVAVSIAIATHIFFRDLDALVKHSKFPWVHGLSSNSIC